MNPAYIDELIEQSKLDEAERLLMAEIEAGQHLSACYFLLGKVYLKREEWGSAINHFSRVPESDSLFAAAQSYTQMARAILGYFNPDLLNP